MFCTSSSGKGTLNAEPACVPLSDFEKEGSTPSLASIRACAVLACLSEVSNAFIFAFICSMVGSSLVHDAHSKGPGLAGVGVTVRPGEKFESLAMGWQLIPEVVSP